MRVTASIIAGLTLSAGVARADGDISRVLAGSPAGPVPAVIPGAETAAELPPLLSVPETTGVRSTGRRNCRSCPTDYNPDLAYLPDNNPDYRGRRFGGGVGYGGCRSAEQFWASADFFVGCGTDFRDVKHEAIYGFKLGLGAWLTSDNTFGLDGSFFNAHDPFREIIGGPFGATLIDSPVTLTTGDLNIRSALYSHCHYRVDLLAGYRYLTLREQLLEGSAGGVNYWQTTNNVNLGQVGAVGAYRFGPYAAELMVKLGFGENREIFQVNGVRTTNNEFAFVPELSARAGYAMGDGARLLFGYNLLYLSEAVRPDNRSPSNYFLNGFTAGLEVRY